MQEVNQALSEVKEIYKKFLGRPAPEIEPRSYASFPPGVDPVRHAVEEVQHLKLLSDQAAAAPAPVAWIPPADCFVGDDLLLIRAEIPAADRDLLKVFAIGGECVIRGERKQPEGTDRLRPLAIERPSGRFERRFPLPAGSLSDKMTARYSDGVLEVRVPVEASLERLQTKVEVA